MESQRMNHIYKLAFVGVLAASLACRHEAPGSPGGGRDVLQDAPSETKTTAFHVVGLMKTKSGAT